MLKNIPSLKVGFTQKKKAIHGISKHGGIDFELPRNTPVLAAADGIAISSYHSSPLTKDGLPVLYKRKQVFLGLGRFVQIFHPKQKLFTQYGHLDKVDSSIKFRNPRHFKSKFIPIGHKIPGERLGDYQFASKVLQGQVIGHAGDSGLGWGYADYPERPDTAKFPSWDEVHLHFELFDRIGSRRIKESIDPYGVYGGFHDYSDDKIIQLAGSKGPIYWKQ